MEYRTLGRTGLRVSEVGLGGEWLQKQSQEVATEIVDACEVAGVNILDCFMAEPAVRTHLGVALRGRRDHWIIQGHIGSVWQNGQYTRTRDEKLIREGFEDLLTRLETDYIDLCMIHYIDEMKDYEEVISGPTLAYARELKAAGKARFIGISSHNPKVARRAVEDGIIDCMLFSLNAAYDLVPPSEDIEELFKENYDTGWSRFDRERLELYRLCEEKGVGITVMKGLGGGRLLDAARSPLGVALTVPQCISYCLDRPAVASVLVGVHTIGEMKIALAYADATKEEKDYSTAIGSAVGKQFMGECTYCTHCAPCPMEIDVAMVNKLADLAEAAGEVPPSVREHYNGLEHNASDCIGCGACESRCPFGVKVVEKMQKTAAMFR